MHKNVNIRPAEQHETVKFWNVNRQVALLYYLCIYFYYFFQVTFQGHLKQRHVWFVISISNVAKHWVRWFEEIRGVNVGMKRPWRKTFDTI